MLGDADVAELIFLAHMDYDVELAYPGEVTFLGSGCYRTVYLYDNVAYKVGSEWANVAEVENSAKLRTMPMDGLPFQLRIPQTYNFGNFGYNSNWTIITQELAVNARSLAEFCDLFKYGLPDPCCTCGQDPCHTVVVQEVQRWSKVGDCHEENILWDGSTYWFVDMGQNMN